MGADQAEDGLVSRSAIEHYRDVLEACHEFGITPMVTLHHFSSPHRLMKLGGWEYEGTPRFAAYCRLVMTELGSLIPYMATINEAKITGLTRRMIEDMTGAKASQSPGAEQAPVGTASVDRRGERVVGGPPRTPWGLRPTR
ncbi:family 1 glycosylhydrolase [Streptomyces sp. NBC_00986]|uniref:family 1 glycosylhydrolase n=1 Tax=Streptomyces sp. NBC_00986 TaxID=2903702 RepID=UPI0038660E94|nr:family 1 glycosylhydrolase [Streptomyces sp. NBC_00986]